MAYGLIYNLNFSSNINGNRKHRISIYKDGVADAITVNDNNIIGTEEPAILYWDNTDDIYNNIMASRLEINLYSDNVKQVDIDDILNNTTPSKFLVQFRMEDNIGGMQLYWEGYLSNATYEQRISSVPVPYQLIATDLLGTLKNIYTTDGVAMIISQSNVIKYIDNVLGFLPQFLPYKISNDIQLKPYHAAISPPASSYTKMHFLQWLFPYSNGFNLAFDTADKYIINTLKTINARIFYAQNGWVIINNSTYQDSASFDIFNESGNYVTNVVENVVKTIPTNFTPILNDMSIRYDTPIDTVEVIANRNEYTTEFSNLGLVEGDVANLSPYPNFETKVNGILFNSTYYSDDFNFILFDPIVKSGNYAIKTQNYITGGNPTQKIMDTGFAGNFQWDSYLSPTFFASYYIQNSGNDTEDFYLFYSITRETSPTSTAPSGAKSYWNGNNWVSYTLESSVAILSYQEQQAPTEQWNEFVLPLPTGGTTAFARYRVILWQPKIQGGSVGTMVVNFDEVFVSRKQVINPFTPIKTSSKISGSNRKNKKLTYEVNHFYPVAFATQFRTNNITFFDAVGSTQFNRLIAQQILNDNRTHIKRYTVSVYPNTFSEFLYPFHKIDLNMTGIQSDGTCIIDRIKYRAKSGVYQLEFHENNQDTNVTLDTTTLGGVV